MITPLRRKLILGWVFNIAFLSLLLAGRIQPAFYLGLISFAVRRLMPRPIPDLEGRLALVNYVWVILWCQKVNRFIGMSKFDRF